MMVSEFIFGLLMILAGRNLFWLCVGIIGFLLGLQAAQSLGLSDNWMSLFLALGMGCLGAILAVTFEWFMVVFGVGFLGGGYLALYMFAAVTGQQVYTWPVFVIGGIVGMCFVIIIFDVALIVISSLLGATLLCNAFQGNDLPRGLLFVVSMATGILVQYLTLKEPSHKRGAATSA